MASIKKALIVLIAAAGAVVIQWSTTGSFSMSEEFITAVYGVVTAAVVYYTRNVKDDPARKAILTTVTAGVAVLIQLASTGHINDTQEFVTAATGLVTAFLVYYVKNTGINVGAHGSTLKAAN